MNRQCRAADSDGKWSQATLVPRFLDLPLGLLRFRRDLLFGNLASHPRKIAAEEPCPPAYFASSLVMAGVDLKTVQELMGYKTIAMIARYTVETLVSPGSVSIQSGYQQKAAKTSKPGNLQFIESK